MQTIANILFDLGNVIVDIDIPGVIENIGALKSPKIDGEEYRAHVMALIDKYEVDAISTDLFINGILKHSHHSVQAIDVIEAWNSMLVGIPEYRLSMLEQLRQNFGVYVLSNTNSLHIAWIHKHLEEVHGVSDFETRFVDEAYYSHLIKARKPNAESYAHVRDDAMITPAKTIFIDDLEENIDGAADLGFQTMHSPPDVEVAETLKILGYY